MEAPTGIDERCWFLARDNEDYIYLCFADGEKLLVRRYEHEEEMTDCIMFNVEENELPIWVKIKNVAKEHPFASHFQEEDFINSRFFVDRLEEVLDKESLQLVKQSGEDHVAKTSKKRRRCAGEFSGRQLALKKLEKEGDSAFLKTEAWPPPFLATVKKMRAVLVEFSEGEEDSFSEDNATAMRVYVSKKLKVSGKDGSNSILTNYFKVALFPSALFSKAVKLCKSYEEGHLLPPSSAKQRQRRSISASTFNFLRGLNPQNVKHQEVIAGKLDNWLETKARPTIEKAELSAGKNDDKALHQKLKEEQIKNQKLSTSLNKMEKKYQSGIDEISKLQKEVIELKEIVKTKDKIIKFLKTEVESLNQCEDSEESSIPSKNTLESVKAAYETDKELINELRDKQGSPPSKKKRLAKHAKGYAYVPELSFQPKNVFEETEVNTRLRKK